MKPPEDLQVSHGQFREMKYFPLSLNQEQVFFAPPSFSRIAFIPALHVTSSPTLPRRKSLQCQCERQPPGLSGTAGTRRGCQCFGLGLGLGGRPVMSSGWHRRRAGRPSQVKLWGPGSWGKEKDRAWWKPWALKTGVVLETGFGVPICFFAHRAEATGVPSAAPFSRLSLLPPLTFLSLPMAPCHQALALLFMVPLDGRLVRPVCD